MISAKYADHAPLYRQEGIYRRSGVELPRAMLAFWVAEAANLLDPLVKTLEQYVLCGRKLHADDTPVPVLAPGKGRTQTGRLWACVRDDRPASGPDPPAVVYRYSPDRKAKRPQSHLRGFSGILQADGYSGFNALYVTRGASTMTSMRWIDRPSPGRRSLGSVSSMPSSVRSEHSCRSIERACGPSGQHRSSRS